MKQILAKLLFCDEKNLHNVLLHIPVGFVNVAIAVLSGPLAVLFGLGFIAYELDGKGGYPELQGWLYGIGFASVIWMMIHIT